MLWFDRKFSFDLMPEEYPNIVERLRGTPARLEERIGSLAVPILTRRDGEAWSIQENAGHLLDLEPLWIGRLDDFAARAETLRAADLQNTKTHQANHNSTAISSILAAFRSERLALIDRLDSLDEAFVLRTSLHPRLATPMRLLDHVFFVAEHDDHHLARITWLLRRSR
jgi:uncharacterized damage-inducible protein DinB